MIKETLPLKCQRDDCSNVGKHFLTVIFKDTQTTLVCDVCKNELIKKLALYSLDFSKEAIS